MTYRWSADASWPERRIPFFSTPCRRRTPIALTGQRRSRRDSSFWSPKIRSHRLGIRRRHPPEITVKKKRRDARSAANGLDSGVAAGLALATGLAEQPQHAVRTLAAVIGRCRPERVTLGSGSVAACRVGLGSGSVGLGWAAGLSGWVGQRVGRQCRVGGSRGITP